jgi:hypothetical protein
VYQAQAYAAALELHSNMASYKAEMHVLEQSALNEDCMQ